MHIFSWLSGTDHVASYARWYDAAASAMPGSAPAAARSSGFAGASRGSSKSKGAVEPLVEKSTVALFTKRRVA